MTKLQMIIFELATYTRWNNIPTMIIKVTRVSIQRQLSRSHIQSTILLFFLFRIRPHALAYAMKKMISRENMQTTRREQKGRVFYRRGAIEDARKNN